MRYEAENITAKDAREFILRSPEASDAEAMLDYLRATAGETHFMIRYPEEVTYTLEGEKELLAQWLSAEDREMIAAWDGDRVIGNVGIGPIADNYKMHHRASLGIAIRKEYWGLGIGKVLMRKAEHAAVEMSFRQLELGVFRDNERGIRLYEGLGYQVYGTLPCAFRLKDGTYRDEVLMIKELGEQEKGSVDGKSEKPLSGLG